MDDVFFQATWAGSEGGYAVRGAKARRLGHRVEDEDGREEGIFAEWRWDGEELQARTDPLGFYPLFYYATDRQVSVASSPLRLIAEGAPSDPDDRALGVFFRLGWFLNEDTPFRAIQVLPPDGRLRWRGNGWEVIGGPKVQSAASASRAEAVEGFIELFRRSVERCARSREAELVLPLSGGRDSRHILFELMRAGVPPSRCVTLSQRPRAGADADARAAAAVAGAVGAEHTVLSPTSSQTRRQLRALSITHFCTDETWELMRLRDYCRSQRCAIMDGIAGDVLSRNKQFTMPDRHRLCREGRFEEVAREMIATDERLRGYSPEDFIGRRTVRQHFPREQAEAYLAQTLSAFAEAADPMSAFLFWNRTRREIALLPGALLTPAQQVLCPYLSRELVSFLSSLPFEATSDGALHDEVIATAFPEHSGLGYDDKQEPPPTPFSLRSKVSLALDAVSAAGRFAPRQAASEMRFQLTYPFSSQKTRLRKLNWSRNYWALLRRLRDARSARRFLENSASMEPTSHSE